MTRWAVHVVIATAVALALLAGLAPMNHAQGRPVTIAITGDAESMDPMLAAISTTSSIHHHMLELLVDYDPDGKIIPVLATSWKALDNLTWEFKLRQGVRFHNGEPFGAEAVKFSIERYRDHAKSLQKAYVSLIKEVRVIDDLTVRIITSEPSPDLIANLANNIAMLPPRYAREVGDDGLARRPVGTGPYRFVEWVRDDKIVLEAYPNYWGPKPQATRVTIKPIPEGATRVAAMLAGEVDVIESLRDLVPTVKVLYVEYDSRGSRRALNRLLDDTHDLFVGTMLLDQGECVYLRRDLAELDDATERLRELLRSSFAPKQT